MPAAQLALAVATDEVAAHHGEVSYLGASVSDGLAPEGFGGMADVVDADLGVGAICEEGLAEGADGSDVVFDVAALFLKRVVADVEEGNPVLLA